MIQWYFDALKRVLDSYAAAPLVLDAQVSFELRPGEQGFVQGAVLFRDQSTLHFREYLDSTASHVSKLMYSYHYQAADQQLVFRYDNARHQPALPVPKHKHADGKVTASHAPVLEDVLIELLVIRGWV